MQLKQGDKRGIWILVDAASGEFIGALHRLAGVQKSKIDALLNSPSANSTIQGLRGIPVPTALNTRLPEDEKAAPYPLQKDVEVAAEVILADIEAIEKVALQTLEIQLPVFSKTPAMRLTAKAIREKEAQLKASRTLRWELADKLDRAPMVRWWCYPLGLAKPRQSAIADLQNDIVTADSDTHDAQAQLSALESRLFWETKAANELLVEQIRQISKKHRLAKETLMIAEAARSIVHATPSIGNLGIDHVLALAKGRIKDGAKSDTHEYAIPTM